MPIIPVNAKKNRAKGLEPPIALCFLAIKAVKKAPAIRPKISGLIYQTVSAL